MRSPWVGIPTCQVFTCSSSKVFSVLNIFTSLLLQVCNPIGHSMSEPLTFYTYSTRTTACSKSGHLLILLWIPTNNIHIQSPVRRPRNSRHAHAPPSLAYRPVPTRACDGRHDAYSCVRRFICPHNAVMSSPCMFVDIRSCNEVL